MLKIFTVVFLLMIASATPAAKPLPFEGARPIAVMVETNPWLMVIGSDTPSFVVYEDGQVIYLEKTSDGRLKYMAKQLAEGELAAMKAKLISFISADAPPRRINLSPNMTDLPETSFYLDVNGKHLVTSVYGLTTENIIATTVSPRSKGADSLPKEIGGLHSYILQIRFTDASEWTPRYLEAMVWGYGYAPEESIHWPKEWPDLDSPSTVKRGDSYSIFLPGEEKERTTAFLSTRKEKGAVEISGKKWFVAVRSVFPSEPTWSRAFRQKD